MFRVSVVLALVLVSVLLRVVLLTLESTASWIDTVVGVDMRWAWSASSVVLTHSSAVGDVESWPVIDLRLLRWGRRQ